MDKILKLINHGWVIVEIRYDRWQKFYYVGASHESQDCESANGSGHSLAEAMDEMYNKAMSLTPEWYLKQISLK